MPRCAVQEVLLASPENTRVGFLGQGIMGVPMALNLINAGYDLTVWNRTAEKCSAAIAAGAQVASSPAEVARKCNIVIAMVSDPEACLELASGCNGVLEGMSSGKGYIDVSTVDADTAKQVAACVRAKGAQYLEAPVSGSKGPAEQGQLIFLTGGDEQLYYAAAPILDVMGKASFFLGDVGAGANMKLVVNMVMGTMMTAFAEGLSLAEESGLSKDDLIEVIKLGAIAAPMFGLKGPSMSQRTYLPAFPLKHQQKDMRLAIALGDKLGQALPTAAAANELYKQARGAGYGDSDFSAVLEAVARQRQ